MPARIASFVCLAVIAFSISVGSIHAQGSETAPISTDRPSATTTPDVLDAHRLQVESGINLSYSTSDVVADLPEGMWRMGIGRRTELRFTSSNMVYQGGASPMQSQDTLFGFKTRLAPMNRLTPQAINLNVSAPVGGSGQSSGTYDPSIVAIWEQSLKSGITFTENIAAVHTSVDGHRCTHWLTSLAVGRALTAKLSAYGEYAPTFSTGGSALHMFDGGFAYVLGPTAQLDLRVGYANDPSGRKNMLSFGYSRRLDNLHLGTLFGR